MPVRDSSARNADSWEPSNIVTQSGSGPEHDLLNWYKGQRRLSGADAQIYKMLIEKERNGYLDNYIISNTSSSTPSMATSLADLQKKFPASKITETSKGSGIYKVSRFEGGYGAGNHRGQGATEIKAYYYVAPEVPKAKPAKVTKKVTTPRPEATGDGTTKRSDTTTTSAKTTPKPELFYSNDYKALQPLTLDKLLVNIVQNARDLLTNYDYASIDEEDTIVGESESDEGSGTSYQTTVSRSIPAGVQNDILDVTLNNKISQYNDISLRITNQIFNQIKNYKSLDSYDRYLSIFQGPFYDEAGRAYYNIALNVDPVDGIIIDGSYVITKEEIG